MANDNLALWAKVEKTDPKHVKAITGKAYSGTSPKPHYLVHKATETFGPCGIGWGFTIEDERIEDGAGGERLSIARVKVWYIWGDKRGEVEHIGGTQFSGTRASGKAFTDEDAPKKSVTDALVKALSMIGFAGDIFMGRYDDSKYVAELKAEVAEAAEAAEAAVPTESEKRIFAKLKADLPGFKTLADMDAWRKTEANTEAFKELPQGLRAELQELMAAKRRELAPAAPAKNRDELRGQLKRSLAEPPVNVLPAG